VEHDAAAQQDPAGALRHRSFAMMMVLAAATSVFGSVAVLSMGIETPDTDEAEMAETTPAAAPVP
jgi:hypothetical protein